MVVRNLVNNLISVLNVSAYLISLLDFIISFWFSVLDQQRKENL